MGELFGGSTKQTSTSTSDSGPSKFQQPYLSTAFDAAKNDFTSKQGTPFYQGKTYASMSDSAKATLDKLKEYPGTAGLGAAGQLSSIGSNLAGYAGKAGSTVDDYLALAAEDPTASLTASARAYADDPNIFGLIDASTRDVARTLNEDTLPTLNRNASGGGNINSSRAGIAEGIARRGAEDRVADISSTIRSDAYKLREWQDFNTLTLSTVLAMTLGAQQVRWPWAMAEVADSGDTLQVVMARYKAGMDNSALARKIAARAQTLKRRLKAATTAERASIYNSRIWPTS